MKESERLRIKINDLFDKISRLEDEYIMLNEMQDHALIQERIEENYGKETN